MITEIENYYGSDESARKIRAMRGDEMQLKILLVDDMRTMRAHTRSMLVGKDFLIDEAEDGQDAMLKMKQFHPHLVLMDIVMPHMDGITCCKKIKQDPAFRETKVVMVTGKGDYEQIAEAFKAGCDDYITKPIDKTELTDKVDELCKYVLARQKLRTFLVSRDPAPKR